MLTAEETRGGPLSVKQLNTVLVFIAIRYSGYCKLYYYYNKYFFLIIAFDVKKGYPLLVQSICRNHRCKYNTAHVQYHIPWLWAIDPSVIYAFTTQMSRDSLNFRDLQLNVEL